jgi:hypothetical protein
LVSSFGPVGDAGGVDGAGGQDVPDRGLGQADVSGAAQAEAADGLGDRALDAGAAVVAAVPGRVVLLGAVAGLDVVQGAGGDDDLGRRPRAA